MKINGKEFVGYLLGFDGCNRVKPIDPRKEIEESQKGWYVYGMTEDTLKQIWKIVTKYNESLIHKLRYGNDDEKDEKLARFFEGSKDRLYIELDGLVNVVTDINGIDWYTWKGEI